MILTENSIRKVLKELRICCAVTSFCSLILFLPQIQSFLITLAESKLGRSINHTIWTNKIDIYTFSFLVFNMLLFFIFILFDKIIQSKQSIPDYLDSKFRNVTTDQWLHYIPLLLFIIVLCIIHFCIAESGDDTAYFNHALQDTSYIDFLKTRYNTWSSRLIIETILINCYRLNFGLWRILDVAAFVLIAECMISICALPKKFSFIVYGVILFFTDYKSLCSAGWGATTVNYLWPLACAMPAFVIIKKIFTNGNISKHQIVISLLLLLFAINQEQVAALCFGLSVSFFVIRLIQNRRLQKSDLYLVSISLLCLISMIFILACPGNANRFTSETKNWFPEYTNLSLFEKIQLGILTVFTYYFSGRGLLTLLPLFLTLTIIYKKISPKRFTVQLCIDALCLVLVLAKVLTKLTKGNFLFINRKLYQFTNFSKVSVLIECFILLFIGSVLIYQIICSINDKKQGLFNAFLLCAGFCSAFIIAFSPTVYASGARCYLFMSYTIFLITFRIFSACFKET